MKTINNFVRASFLILQKSVKKPSGGESVQRKDLVHKDVGCSFYGKNKLSLNVRDMNRSEQIIYPEVLEPEVLEPGVLEPGVVESLNCNDLRNMQYENPLFLDSLEMEICKRNINNLGLQISKENNFQNLVSLRNFKNAQNQICFLERVQREISLIEAEVGQRLNFREVLLELKQLGRFPSDEDFLISAENSHCRL